MVQLSISVTVCCWQIPVSSTRPGACWHNSFPISSNNSYSNSFVSCGHEYPQCNSPPEQILGWCWWIHWTLALINPASTAEVDRARNYQILQTDHPLTSSRHHPPAAAATTNPWLSFGFQRPHRPNFELFWSAAVAAAGLGCLSRRVCAVKPKDVVNVFGRCRPVKTRRRLRVC